MIYLLRSRHRCVSRISSLYAYVQNYSRLHANCIRVAGAGRARDGRTGAS